MINMEQGVGNLDYFMQYFFWNIYKVCILQKNYLPIAKPKPNCDKNVGLYVQQVFFYLVLSFCV